MHILLTGNTAYKLYNFRSGLIRTLISDGNRLTALVPAGQWVSELEEMGCEIVPLHISRKGMLLHQELMLLLKFWRVFRDKRPDAVFSYTIKNNLYGALAARVLGIPFLPNVTGLGTAFADSGFLNRIVIGLYKAAFKKVPVVFFQNHDDPVLFGEMGIVRHGQVRILPGSGVDTTRFRETPLPGNGKNLTFLMISRLLRDKGVAEYVDAARIVRKKYPGALFQLLGPFDFENYSAIDESKIRSWSNEGIIQYLGELEDVRPATAKADCIILPSYYREGIPRVLLEAAAMARPIVTTNTPGCREAVEDGVTGFLCRPRDVADLVRKIEIIIKLDQDSRTKMGKRAREMMEQNFEERIVIDAYMNELKCIGFQKEEKPI